MKKQRVSVADGWIIVEYSTIGKVFRGELSKLPQSVYVPCDAANHGMKQKLGDAESGKSPSEKYAMVQRIWENLLTGAWELTATPDHSGIVIEAVCRLQKIKQPVLEKKLNALGDEARAERIKTWASNVKVKAEVAKIRAERAAKAAEETDDEDPKIDL